MVSYNEIKASNALINDSSAPRVAVFVGGTSGIGKLTIKALAACGTSLKIYIVGRRSAEELTRAVIQELRAINSRVEAIWIEGEVSLLAETQRICQIIKGMESSVDLLFMTTGYAPFGPRQETSEGIEIVQSLEYYTRVLFILQLLPLLHKAETPRVISVLGGGLERAMVNLDDLDLKKPGNFSAFRARPQYIDMNTAGLEKLAKDNPDVTFIHSWPGLVNTGNVRRGRDPNSFWGWFVWLIAEPLIGLLSFSDEESGQRYLFQCTSAAFGGLGVPWQGKPGINSLEEQANGLFLVDRKCECTPNPKYVSLLRETGQKRIWEHTEEMLQPHLSAHSS